MAQWKWCVENDNGTLVKGWYKYKNDWYYLKENGTMFTGWLIYKDKWYYMNKDGVMCTSCIINIDGVNYTFDSNGALIESLVSDKCIEFIKSYEGFSSKAYYDGTGYTDKQLTIGYGTTKASVPVAFPNGTNSTCTKEQATKWLKDEVEKYAERINRDLNSKNVKLKQHEFDSLCSFAYNCGVGALLGSTLYKRVCSGVRDSSLKDNFTAWSMAGGKRLQGLYNRRCEEYDMFANEDYKRDL